jgi:5-methyltetrahydrofolate--homocysteine methyltransferase
MIIVGELINASRKAVAEAISKGDADAIAKIATDQVEAGVQFVDVNAGVFVEEEADYLKWLVTVVQDGRECPCCIDSPSVRAIEAALSVHRGTAMINSISLEKDRYESLLPLVAGTNLKVVALCMSDEGMPETTDDRLKIAGKLINGLTQANVPVDNIYVDPLVQPLSVNTEFGVAFLEAIECIMKEFQGVHTMCGLSNISFGLPERKVLNQAFAVMAIDRGLDGLIVNPLDRRMMANIISAEALTGRDQYCMSYLKAFRAKRFEL